MGDVRDDLGDARDDEEEDDPGDARDDLGDVRDDSDGGFGYMTMGLFMSILGVIPSYGVGFGLSGGMI